MNRKEKIRVEVVDDHPVVRDGLTAIINQCQDMQVVAEAANGREAVSQFNRHHPDVVLMDLSMPEADGVTAIREIVRANPDARIAVLTTYAGDHDIRRAFQAGAKAYLLKGSPKQTLLDAIQSVYTGEQAPSLDVVAKLAKSELEPQLSVRELVVLGCLADGQSNAEIARKLEIEVGTVKVHVHRVLQKLGVKSRTEAIATALKKGIVHLPESGSP